jgi:TRAP-type C4-dicarboxylate transport system permease large subunit
MSGGWAVRPGGAWTSSLLLVLLVVAVGIPLTEAAHLTLRGVMDAQWPGLVQSELPPPTCVLKQTMERRDQECAAGAEAPLCVAFTKIASRCTDQWLEHTRGVDVQGPQVFRRVEHALGAGAAAARGARGGLLLGLLFVGAAIASVRGEGIALRAPRTPVEFRLVHGLQLMTHGALVAAALADLAARGTLLEGSLTHGWAAGFAGLAAVDGWRLWRAGERSPGTWSTALPTVPLHTWMAGATLTYFALVTGDPGAAMPYLRDFTTLPDVYLAIPCLVWSGNLLMQTRVPDAVFGVLRPWRLPAPWQAWLVVCGAALPTAYVGASGVFVSAAGPTLYRELRAGGLTAQRARGATALAGSLGAVLSPSLLVVLISASDLRVSTGELFAAGRWVFVLTAVAAAVTLSARWGGEKWQTPTGAASAAGQSLVRLWPYVVACVAVWCVLAWGLGLVWNAATTWFWMPLLCLAWAGVEGSVRRASLVATEDAAPHIGGLLMLMAMTMCLGGTVAHAGVVDLAQLPDGRPVLAMAILVAILVVGGMVMEPLGAVLLVASTLVRPAEAAGIGAVHFWMVVLVAFELGYVTPPVAINRLLARRAAVQVDGEAGLMGPEDASPFLILGVSLLLVAFGPLMVGWRI